MTNQFIPKLNTIYCGDAYEILPLIPDNYFNCMITDPPFNLKNSLKHSNLKNKNKFIKYGYYVKSNVLKKELKTLTKINLKLIIREGMRISKDKIVAVYGFNDEATLHQYITTAHASGFNYHLLTYHSQSSQMAGRQWFLRSEIILVVYDKKIKKTWSAKNYKYFHAHNQWRSYGHPYKKSVQESQWLLNILARPGGRIIDPFCGGGTLLKVAKMKGYQIFGIDQSQYWVNKVNNQLNFKDRHDQQDQQYHFNQSKLF